jgi:hypothetical protein
MAAWSRASPESGKGSQANEKQKAGETEPGAGCLIEFHSFSAPEKGLVT